MINNIEENQKNIEQEMNIINGIIFKNNINYGLKIDEIIITDKNQISNKDKCIICLENYSIGDKVCYLPCLHLFHSLCIKNWIEIKNNCPLCNYNLD